MSVNLNATSSSTSFNLNPLSIKPLTIEAATLGALILLPRASATTLNFLGHPTTRLDLNIGNNGFLNAPVDLYKDYNSNSPFPLSVNYRVQKATSSHHKFNIDKVKRFKPNERFSAKECRGLVPQKKIEPESTCGCWLKDENYIKNSLGLVSQGFFSKWDIANKFKEPMNTLIPKEPMNTLVPHDFFSKWDITNKFKQIVPHDFFWDIVEKIVECSRCYCGPCDACRTITIRRRIRYQKPNHQPIKDQKPNHQPIKDQNPASHANAMYAAGGIAALAAALSAGALKSCKGTPTKKKYSLNGQGTIFTASNRKIAEGSWVNSKLHGMCTLYKRDGTLLYRGEFSNGKPIYKLALSNSKV